MLHNNFPTRFSARIGKMLSYKNDKWQRQAGRQGGGAGRGEATSKSRTGWHVLSWHTHVTIMRQVQHTCKNVICLSIISMSFSGPCSTHTLTHKIICTPISISYYIRVYVSRLFLGGCKLPQ